MNTYIAGVVVLNYMNYDYTIKCVESLINDNYKDVFIVVVDNGSKNNSLSILNSEFKDICNVKIISLNENLGYAKGNNEGIKILRKMGIDNIFVANSDLIFPNSPVMIQMMDRIESGDAVIVPTIKNPDGGLDQRVIYKKKLFVLRMLKELLKSIARNLKGEFAAANRNYSYAEVQTHNYDDCYVVSGSGFMLTRHFFAHYKGLFSDTFLYGEECGTIMLLNKSKLHSRVVDTDVIMHIGGASTPDSVKKMTKARQQINLDSDIKLLKLLFVTRKNAESKY